MSKGKKDVKTCGMTPLWGLLNRGMRAIDCYLVAGHNHHIVVESDYPAKQVREWVERHKLVKGTLEITKLNTASWYDFAQGSGFACYSPPSLKKN